MVSLAEQMLSSVIAIGMRRKLDEDVYFTAFPFFSSNVEVVRKIS